MGLNKGKGGNLRKASWILKPKKRPQRGRNVHPPPSSVKTAKERRDGAGFSVLPHVLPDFFNKIGFFVG